MIPFARMLEYGKIIPSSNWFDGASVAFDDEVLINNSDLLGNPVSNRGISANRTVIFPYNTLSTGLYMNVISPTSSTFGGTIIDNMPGKQVDYTSWSIDYWCLLHSSSDFNTSTYYLDLMRGYDSSGFVTLQMRVVNGMATMYLVNDAGSINNIGQVGSINSYIINGVPFHIAMNCSTTYFELFLNGVRVFRNTNSSQSTRVRDKIYNAIPFNNTLLRLAVQNFTAGSVAYTEYYDRVRIFSGIKFPSTGFDIQTIYPIMNIQ